MVLLDANEFFEKFTILKFSQIIAVVISLIPIFALIRNSWERSRRKLKLDLELLEKFDSSDSSYKIIKEYIDYRIKQTYKIPVKIKLYHKNELIIGIIYTILFSIIATLTYSTDSWWWWFLTCVYSLNGVFLIISSFRKISWVYVYDEE